MTWSLVVHTITLALKCSLNNIAIIKAILKKYYKNQVKVIG